MVTTHIAVLITSAGLVVGGAGVTDATGGALGALGVQDDIKSKCQFRVETGKDQSGEEPYWARVDMYCSEVPPIGWKVRAGLDRPWAGDPHTPYIQNRDTGLIGQWVLGETHHADSAIEHRGGFLEVRETGGAIG